MPFTTEQFFEVFREYNLFVYPVQLIILLFGLTSLFIVRSKNKYSVKIIGIYLIFLWIWTGYVYHIKFFSVINKAAFAFGILFIAQGLLFSVEFFIRKRVEFVFENKFQIISGYFFIIFGVIIYPLIGLISGKSLDITISMGLPCPSVIYTFGILVLAGKSLPKYILIIPVVWALIGFFAAINFGVYQDIVLPISSFMAIYILHFYKRKGVPAK